MFLTFKKIRYKNFLSSGNINTEIDLNTHNSTLVLGLNGQGKCLDKNTKIDISIENYEVLSKFKEFMKR